MNNVYQDNNNHYYDDDFIFENAFDRILCKCCGKGTFNDICPTCEERADTEYDTQYLQEQY